MTSFLLITASILLGLSLAYLLDKKFDILHTFSKTKSKKNVFLTDEECIRLLEETAFISGEEKENLSVIFSLVSGYKLHQGLDNHEIAEQWLINARRAIANANQFDQNTKNGLEFTAYEVFRKIHNARTLAHPNVKSIADIPIGQKMTLKIGNTSFKGTFVNANFYSFSVNLTLQDSMSITIKNLVNKTTLISFWKKFDAEYTFQSFISSVSQRDGIKTLSLSIPKKIQCSRIREYPRINTEIPVKYRQGEISTDSNTGALQESFSNLIFGIINNIGSMGCSIISHVPAPLYSHLMIELPILGDIFFIKGVIRNISQQDQLYLINIQFDEETPRDYILKLYYYIFAEDSSK